MTPTRYVALFFLAQSAPSVFLGYVAWGSLAAVLGCAMWLAGAMADTANANAIAQEVSARQRLTTARLDALLERVVGSERELVGRLDALDALATTQAKEVAKLAEQVSALATQRVMRSI